MCIASFVLVASAPTPVARWRRLGRLHKGSIKNRAEHDRAACNAGRHGFPKRSPVDSPGDLPTALRGRQPVLPKV